MSTELNLIVIRSDDIDSAAEFYRMIGLPIVEERHGSGPRHYAAELGKLVFEIYPLGKRKSTQDVRLGFFVLSLDDTIWALDETTVIKQPPARTERGYMAVIEDPDGHIVELIQTEVTD